MTVKEARKFIAILMVTYPNYKPTDVELAANTWANVTEDYSYEQISVALNAYMKSDTSGFAPTPGQIIDKIQKMVAPQYLNEMEAWALVRRAIGRGGEYYVEDYAKLPPLVQKAVGLPSQIHSWAMDTHFSETTVSREFITAYRTIVQRQEELEKMPDNIKALIAKVNEGYEMAQIQDKRDKAINSVLEDKEAERKALTMAQGQDMPDGVREKYEIMKKEWKEG